MNYRERIDYSSLTTYLECPRKFFFQYVLHFRSSRPSIHLVFGSAWHYGLETTYAELKAGTPLTPADAREISIRAFNALWSLEGEPHFEPDLVYPKSPARAADMYDRYWKQHLDSDLEKTVLGVESPFTIDLSVITPGMPNYIGRLDLVFEHQDGSLEVVDHKTASSINKITGPGFNSSFQTDGYLTAGHMFYDKLPEVTYRVALCQKTKIAFEDFTFSKRQSALDRFLQDLINHCSSIINNLKLLEIDQDKSSDKSYIMPAFLRKPGYACTSYFSTCPYFDLCNFRNNPMTWKDSPPQGYSVNEWDPVLHEANLKAALENL